MGGLALAGALTGLGGPAAARETVVEPSSKWVLNYAPERCSLIRIFGVEDETLRFEIESFGRRRFYRALLAGRPVPRTSDAAGAIKLRLRELGLRRTDALHGSANDIPAVSFIIASAPPDEMGEESRARQPLPAYEAGVDRLDVRFQSREITLQLGSMAMPLKAMRDCVDSLYKQWGLDPEQQKTLSREPSPKRSTVRRLKAHYPVGKLNSGVSAFVPVRIRISADGEPSDCTIQHGSVDEDFRKAVRSNLSGSFEPALDRDGIPVPKHVPHLGDLPNRALIGGTKRR